MYEREWGLTQEVQRGQRPGVCGGPGMGAGVVLKGAGFVRGVPRHEARGQAKAVYEVPQACVLQRSVTRCSPLMNFSSSGKQELTGVPLSLHCLFSLLLILSTHNYI